MFFIFVFIFSFEYDPKLADCSEANINHFRKFSEESKLNMVKIVFNTSNRFASYKVF